MGHCTSCCGGVCHSAGPARKITRETPPPATPAGVGAAVPRPGETADQRLRREIIMKTLGRG